ncbi:unnamed protein product [Miscanthus lutarioriparius]|uniref:Uncharacterized protein n=1 Tax=Miscanthus lutarioriparius TaxID=422564 RepID=A0A811N0N4_9POAL|nr:unnamed protein product [Miscanthus lutarioriparius]
MRVGGGRDDEEVSRKLKSMDVDKLENGGGEESPRPPRPAVKYHGWKAMPFIIGNETFEKLGTLGTSANLLVYLTQVFHMRSVDAATLLNGLNGTTSLAPIIGAFLSDAYLGRYLALAIASVASLIYVLYVGDLEAELGWRWMWSAVVYSTTCALIIRSVSTIVLAQLSFQAIY